MAPSSEKGKGLGDSTLGAGVGAGAGQSSNPPSSSLGASSSHSSNHSAAKTQRLKSIDKRNTELFEEIMELRKIRGMINVFKGTIEEERVETLQGENRTKNSFAVSQEIFALFRPTPEQKAADDAYDEEIMEGLAWLSEKDTAWDDYFDKHHEHEVESVELVKEEPHVED